jgi:hypothetical protein
MTGHTHQQRSGRRRRQKQRKRQPLGIGGDLTLLVIHRELEALRHPNRRRLRKLAEVKHLRP